MKKLIEALTFDDVLIVPSKSSIKPSEADISTFITKNIKLKIPNGVGPMVPTEPTSLKESRKFRFPSQHNCN